MSTANANLISRRRDVAMILFVAAILILAVVYSVFSATTIADNINTGGTLTVTGVSTLTGAAYASSTLQATGDGLFYDQLSAGASTNTPTTTFNVTGSGYFTGGLGVGYATTGAGNLLVQNLGVFQHRLGVATTSPVLNFEVTGSGYLTGGLGVGFATTAAGQLHVTSNATFDTDVLLTGGRIVVNGAGTSTFVGGVSAAGLSSSAGITSSAGDFLLTGGKIVSTGAGTSTYSGGISSAGLRSTSGIESTAGDFLLTGGRIVSTGAGTSSMSGALTVTELGVFSNRLGVNASTSPYRQLGVTGDVVAASAGTTTLSVESTGATISGCIEIKGSVAGAAGGTKWVRMYVASGSSASSTRGQFVVYAGGDSLLVIEPGRCQ